MKIELDKIDVIRLIVSCCPDYNVMDKFKKLGYYVGGHCDRWEWNDISNNCWSHCSTEELYELYIKYLKK